jgi:hypothetical protein
MNRLSLSTIFALDSSVIISGTNLDSFCIKSKRLLYHTSKLVPATKLASIYIKYKIYNK